MWVIEPPKVLKESLSQNVNFLFSSGNVHIMDNHLCAGWLWANHLDLSKSYKLFHVDRHYDLSFIENAIVEAVVQRKIDISKITIQDYIKLKWQYGDYENEIMPVFQWDNYIANLNYLYPNLFNEKLFSCHESGDTIEGFITEELSFEKLPDNISYWIKREKEANWIFNFDLDFFFMEIDNDTIQIFTDEYIVAITKSIKEALNYIDILTISISPECCGNWFNALRVNEMVCRILEIEFPELSGNLN